LKKGLLRPDKEAPRGASDEGPENMRARRTTFTNQPKKQEGRSDPREKRRRNQTGTQGEGNDEGEEVARAQQDKGDHNGSANDVEEMVRRVRVLLAVEGVEAAKICVLLGLGARARWILRELAVRPEGGTDKESGDENKKGHKDATLLLRLCRLDIALGAHSSICCALKRTVTVRARLGLPDSD